MLSRFYVPVFFFFAFSAAAQAQQSLTDSLIGLYRAAVADSVKVKLLDDIASGYIASRECDLARAWSDTLLQFSEKTENVHGIARSNNIKGNSFLYQNNYSRALPFYFKYLELSEQEKNKQGIASANNNIGICYSNLNDNKLAKEYLLKALQGNAELNNLKGIAGTCNSIGNMLMDEKKYTEALGYFQKALESRKTLGDERGLAGIYNNIGLMYKYQGMYDTALVYYRQALGIKAKFNDKAGMASSLSNIGQVLCENKTTLDSAIIYLDSAINVAEQTKNIDVLKTAYNFIGLAYEQKGEFQQALVARKKYEVLKDSMFNQENTRQSIQAKMDYEFDKRDAIKKAEYQAGLEKRNLLLWSAIAVLLIVAVFSVFLYNRFKLTQRQKLVIEVQKKEMLDSINYARRLQEAILPAVETVQRAFADNFILYKPKDIVAGDFYWFERIGGISFIAAADCTGHGVPGALVSVVCSGALNRAVLEFGLTEPGKILDKTRELVLETFSKSDKDVKDGMDISLCAFHGNKLSWAGANNPLWYFSSGELHEIKADKQAIGKTDEPKPFTTHTLELKTGDWIYLFTDGYADQFGGPKGKKLMYKQFKEHILSVFRLPGREQKNALDTAFENWKSKLEQVDDVCVVGIKI
ncbi:MAG: protein serine/threonine phosphatase [Bacteroidetes bacterium]|nr:MAG: protein serine/threonine phosphatase [Bacteroidota bacterium]